MTPMVAIRGLWRNIPDSPTKNALRNALRRIRPRPFPSSYIAELQKLDVVDAGLTDDGVPFIVLGDNTTLYGSAPLDTEGHGGWYFKDRDAYRRLPKAVRDKIPPVAIRVALDTILRFVYPHATPDLAAPPYSFDTRYAHWFGQHANTIDDLNWDEKRKSRLKSHFRLGEGDVILDVGACFGHGAIRYSRMVGKTGRVICVEVDPVMQDLFRRNMASNSGCDNVKLYTCGVWDRAGEMELHVGSVHRQDNTLRANSFLPRGETIVVPTDTIDNIVVQENLDRVDLVSLTINTAEIEAVSGMEETIRRFRPCLSVAGWLKLDCGRRVHEILTEVLLKYPGYKVVVGRSGRLLAWYDDEQQ